MNNIINKFLLVGDKFMPETHLRQPRFVYSTCGPFTRHKVRIKKFKQTGDTRYIYRNELDKACFQHDSAYADHKDLLYKLLYLELCKLLKRLLIMIKIIIKDMVYVLMKEVSLVIQ